jgi:ketosteroid isomerase-like protein
VATFPEILEIFKSAVETCDTEAFTGLFTEDASYEDSVYGLFKGHAELSRMLRDIFHQDATDFRWEMSDPVCDGNIGYANYRFSLKPSHPEAAEGRALLAGCAQFTLKDGRIAAYKEWGNVAGTLLQSGVPDNVVLRYLKREAKALRERPDFAAHISD